MTGVSDKSFEEVLESYTKDNPSQSVFVECILTATNEKDDKYMVIADDARDTHILIKIDQKDNFVLRQDLSAYIDETIYEMAVDNNENIYLLDDTKIYIWNVYTKEMLIIPSEEILTDLSKDAKGNVIVATYNERLQSVIKRVNLETEMLDEILALPASKEGHVARLIYNKRYSVCFCNGKGFFGYDDNVNSICRILDWER